MHNLKLFNTKLSEFLDLFYKVFRNFDFYSKKNGFFEETEIKNIHFSRGFKKKLKMLQLFQKYF